ncbi:hypothetical protein GCM10011389_15310 [Pontibacillus salipaludis]|uniref:Uncharacterized protein n=1 Tax=Pontibacillus salipaludis TaxID=1697394 RepID=A0ABQ1Q0Z9_9BACI|nr:hypothetical protein GCM10011389_15310 [Pontibacillus salipaludis]
MSMEMFLPNTTSGALIIGIILALVYSLYLKKTESKGWGFTLLTFVVGVISCGIGVMILQGIGTIE